MGEIVGRYLMPHPPILIDEIGKESIRDAQDTYNACLDIGKRIAEAKPDTIIVITPHGQVFNDAIAVYVDEKANGDMSRFGNPNIKLNTSYDINLSQRIIDESKESDIYAVMIDEDAADIYDIEFSIDHGTFVPLYFVDKYYKDFKIVQINYGYMDPLKHYRAGMLIEKAIEESDKRIAIIASGDLSHRLKDSGPYDYHPSGSIFDEKLMELLSNGDISGIFNMDDKVIGEAGECGMNSIYMLLGILDRFDIKGEVLSYEGPFGVGYGVVDFSIKGAHSKYNMIKQEIENKYKAKINKESEIVSLARQAINAYACSSDIIDIPRDLSKALVDNRAGVFVSIKKLGNLRGCIGSLMPTKSSLASEVIHNAIKAGFEDPRFSQVQTDELRDLDISVDVLESPEIIDDIDLLDVKKYGVIVENEDKVGVLLPNLDGVDTIQDQLDIAMQKADIDSSEKFIIKRFEVKRYT